MERTGMDACLRTLAVRLGAVTLSLLLRDSALITTRSQPPDSVRRKIRSKAASPPACVFSTPTPAVRKRSRRSSSVSCLDAFVESWFGSSSYGNDDRTLRSSTVAPKQRANAADHSTANA